MLSSGKSGQVMSIFDPEYETYQDVKNTLAWWAVPVWAALMYCLFYLVLQESHRRAILGLIPGLAEWKASAGAIVVLFMLAGIVSHIAVHVLEIHDHIYDRHLIRWRERYAREVMIPKLLDPYKVLLSDDVVAAARLNQGHTLRMLFYRFAGDRDTKIKQNLIVRFYERIAKYWLTQIVEIAAILLVVTTILYGAFFYTEPPPTGPGWMLLGIIVVVVINRMCIRILRKSVQEATQEEIADIHASCKDEFARALAELQAEYGGKGENHGSQA